jgi:hypothetical protein
MRAARVASLLAGVLFALAPTAASTAKAPDRFATTTAPLFAERFEGALSRWLGRGGGAHSGVIVPDPLRAGNHVLSFKSLASGGDIFGPTIPVSKAQSYRLTFEYLGKAGSGGGIVGIALGTPAFHRWLVGTQQKGSGESNPLVDDGRWHSYTVEITPGARTWFTADGSRAVKPQNISVIRLMLETHWGVPGDAYFDNFVLSPCASCGSELPAARPSRVSAGASWDGVWKTTFGAMTLRNSGNSVCGTYTYKHGRVKGTVAGRVFRGAWDQDPTHKPRRDAGDFQFTLSSAGNSFTGRWRYGHNGSWHQTPWNGKRIARKSGTCRPAKPPSQPLEEPSWPKGVPRP